MKRFASFLLAVLLMLTAIPVTANAATLDGEDPILEYGASVGEAQVMAMNLMSTSSQELYEMDDIPEGEEYQYMSASQEIIDLIKDFEGFSSEPYWDKSQWTVGYGTRCSGPDVRVTREQAERMLRDMIDDDFEPIVNSFCKKNGKQPTQQQFDALLDLTYNAGGAWTSGEAVPNAILNPSSALDIVKGLGAWSRSGGKVSYVHVNRRIREALIYLYGEYYLAYGGQDCKYDLEVIDNNDLPYFKAVIFKCRSGEFDGGRTDYAGYYTEGDYYVSFPEPSRSGYTLVGWKITKRSNDEVDDGERISAWDTADENLELTAVWEKGVFEVEPEEPPVDYNPDEPTEPEEPETPTEPEQPTEPEVPAEPEQPSEPEQPTEPETPSEPEEPTEPEQPSEPEEPTEPEEPSEPETPSEPEEPTEPEEPEMEPVPDVEIDMNRLPFTDVPQDAWFRDAVSYVYRNEFMNGTSATTFAPEGSMTRGMLVTVLYRIDGSEPVCDQERECFDDIADAYYTDAVAWAYANGIVNGVDAHTFAPNRIVTRQEAVTIFYRYCMGQEMAAFESEVDLNGFEDRENVAGFALDAFAWAVSTGLVQGSASAEGVYLDPTTTLNRAQAAVLLQRCVEEIM